jgi:hypothetical protein
MLRSSSPVCKDPTTDEWLLCERICLLWKETVAFLETVKGVCLSGGDFAGSLLTFPGRDGASFSSLHSKLGHVSRVKALIRGGAEC